MSAPCTQEVGRSARTKVTRGWIDSHYLGDVRVQAPGVCTQSVMSTWTIRSNVMGCQRTDHGCLKWCRRGDRKPAGRTRRPSTFERKKNKTRNKILKKYPWACLWCNFSRSLHCALDRFDGLRKGFLDKKLRVSGVFLTQMTHRKSLSLRVTHWRKPRTGNHGLLMDTTHTHRTAARRAKLLRFTTTLLLKSHDL